MKNNQSTLIIRLPNELKHKVELMAEEQGVSLNQFALYAFTKEVIQTETQSYFQNIWKNKSKKPVVLLSTDIMHEKSDPHAM